MKTDIAVRPALLLADDNPALLTTVVEMLGSGYRVVAFGRTPETGERAMVLMRWGLIPIKIANPDSFKIVTTANARAEGILDKPIWKGPFTRTRCLVPIDAFYEWLQRPTLPQPPPIEPGEHGLLPPPHSPGRCDIS
jgi:putative SOS response-associated peptidase YedK